VEAEIRTARDLFGALGMEYWQARVDSARVVDPAGG
jgi:hypothetical protein